MLVAVVIAVVLGVGATALYVRGNKANEQAASTEAARARLAAEREELWEKVARLEGDLSAAREEASRYRTLVQEAGDWVWETDADGVITFSNPAGAALLGVEDLVGRNAKELTHPDDAEAVTAGFSGVIRRRHADGTFKTLDTRSAPGPGGGWPGIDRDLTAPAPPAPEPAPEKPGVALV